MSFWKTFRPTILWLASRTFSFPINAYETKVKRIQFWSPAVIHQLYVPTTAISTNNFASNLEMSSPRILAVYVQPFGSLSVLISVRTTLRALDRSFHPQNLQRTHIFRMRLTYSYSLFHCVPGQITSRQIYGLPKSSEESQARYGCLWKS